MTYAVTLTALGGLDLNQIRAIFCRRLIGLVSAGPKIPGLFRAKLVKTRRHWSRDGARRSPLKFAMVTTFFGAHSFGGDAAYVDRLARALCRRGHEVHVFHCVDAFNAVRGRHPAAAVHAAARPACPPAGKQGRHPLAPGHADDRPAGLQGRGAAAGARRGRHRRRPLPQHLAGRGARGARAGPPGRADHDGARALADLPDAPALEVRPQALRRCRMHPLQPAGTPAAPGLAADRGDRPGTAGARRPDLPEPARPRGAPAAGGSTDRSSTSPISSPTTGRGGSRTKTRSPRPRSGPTSPRPGGWWP